MLLYTLVGFYLLPWIIERQLLSFADQRLQRPMSIERVRVNPYSLALTIEGLKLDETDGTALAALREFHINFEASSLVRRAWTFDAFHAEAERCAAVTYFWGPLSRAATLGQLGHPDASGAVRELLDLKPDFAANGHTLIERYIKFEDLRHQIIDGLSRAGLNLEPERR